MKARGWKVPKDKFVTAIKLLVAGGLLFLLTKFVPINEVGVTLVNSYPPYLFIALGFVFVGILISSIKLYKLAKLFSPDLKLVKVLKSYYIGTFFNNFLPTGLGGDLIKINELRGKDLSINKASASVVVERGMGLLAVLLYATGFAAFWPEFLESLELGFLRIPLLIVSVFLLFILFVVALSSELQIESEMANPTKKVGNKIQEKIYSWFVSFFVFRDNKKIMFETLILSLFFHSINASALVLLSLAIGSELSFKVALGCIPFIAIVDVIPVSIGSLGIREGVITYVLTQVGISPVNSLSVALLFRTTYYFHSIVGGIIYGLPSRLKREPN